MKRKVKEIPGDRQPDDRKRRAVPTEWEVMAEATKYDLAETQNGRWLSDLFERVRLLSDRLVTVLRRNSQDLEKRGLWRWPERHVSSQRCNQGKGDTSRCRATVRQV